MPTLASTQPKPKTMREKLQSVFDEDYRAAVAAWRRQKRAAKKQGKGAPPLPAEQGA